MTRRPQVPRVGGTEENFRYCNNRGRDASINCHVRIENTLRHLDVSKDQFDEILYAAMGIWKDCQPVLRKNPKATFRNLAIQKGLREAKLKLREQFQQVFEPPYKGPEEEKFLCETAPEGIFQAIHRGVYRYRPSLQKLVAANLNGKVPSVVIPRQDKDLGIAAADQNPRKEDTAKEGQLPAEGKERRAAVAGESMTLAAFDEKPTSNDVKREDQTELGISKEPSDDHTAMYIEFEDKTGGQQEPKHTATAARAKRLQSGCRLTRRGAVTIDLTAEEKPDIKEEKAEPPSTGASLRNAPQSEEPHRQLETTRPELPAPNQPLSLEIYSTKAKYMILRLELKHLVEEGQTTPSLPKLEEEVRRWPFVTWPSQLIFIYVSTIDGSNTPIFSQKMLETAFEDWLRQENTGFSGRYFRLYVNDSDGPPPMVRES